jgi:phosphohistidine phosphatase
MTRYLHLLRHAKSSWADAEQPDRERPLAPRGRRAAGKLAGRLEKLAVRPDLVLCSPAARTRQTLELIRPGLEPEVEVRFDDALYGAGAPELLERVRAVPARVGAVLVIGHNPGLQELTVLLAAASDLRERARAHFPTAALASLSLVHARWADLQAGEAELVAFLAPRELD